MKKSKWLTLFLVSIMVLSLFAGCTNDSSSSDNGDKGAEEEKAWTGEITVWDAPRWADENDNKFHWIEAKAAEFEQAHPGVKVKIVQKPWAEMADNLNVAIAGRAWPDVAPVDISGGAVSEKQVEQGVIESMDPFLTEEELADFYPNALDAYTVEGKLYGVPTALTVHAMLLNLDIFEAQNVEPPKDGKWTFAEFAEKMKQLTHDKDGDGKDDVFGFSTYILPGYYEAWPFFFINGGRPLSDDLSEYTFDDPAVVSAVKQLADLKLIDNAAPQEMGGADVGGTWKAFADSAQRTVAVEPWATWAIQAAQGEKFKTNFMVAEYPTGETGEPVTISGVGGWVMFHQEDEAKKKVVAEFIKYISATEEQVLAAKKYGVFPARESAADQNPFADNPAMARAQELTTHGVSLPRHTEWKKIDEVIQKELQLVFNGEKTAEQALKDARPAVEEFLNK